MHRFTLHVPETLNDGTPVELNYFARLESALLNVGGGFTMTHGIGAWTGDDGTVYREPVRLYHVDTADPGARDQLRQLSHAVAIALDQEAVYLTETELATSLVTV